MTPPITTIVGTGRIGTALAAMGEAVLVRRGESITTAEGPIYVCTRNDDLDAVVAATLPQRRRDLVFLQNGMLRSWLQHHQLQDNTQALIYFAVQAKGDQPVDGGGTVVWGRWAEALASRLQGAGLECSVVDRLSYGRQMVEKLLWNCIFGLLSQYYQLTVGEVVQKQRQTVELLVDELGPLAEQALAITLVNGVSDRLCNYSLAVADYRGAVKELAWRNGWFLKLAVTPKHRELLEAVGIEI